MDVHPLAAIFPVLDADELAELAADIKANGLIHPIMLDGGDQLIDGRNRLAACELAGVEPRFERLNGVSAEDYIIAANIDRRHLTKGQRAVALAMVWPEASPGGRGKADPAGKAAETSGFSARRVQQARTVLRHDPDLAAQVLGGALPLDTACEIVRERQAQASGLEGRMARLRDYAPDFADQVTEGRMTLAEAEGAASARAQERQRLIDEGRSAATRIKTFAAGVTAVIGAYELGERDLIAADDLENMRAALGLLGKTVDRSTTNATG